MIGIVILNYETWQESVRCIQSICDSCKKLLFRIYLVDNASKSDIPDEIKRYSEKLGDQFVFIRSESNNGYAAGNNLGIKRALEDNCHIFIIANNDIVFGEGSIEKMAVCLQEYPEVGIVGPKVLNDRNEVQNSRCSMKTGGREIFQIYTAAKLLCRKKWKEYFCLNQDVDTPSYVYHVSGCCFAMSERCARVITPFDEGTLLYNEEFMIGIRMEKSGFLTRYEPESVVLHHHEATTGKRPGFKYQCICQSEQYYGSKYLKLQRWQLWLLYHYRKVLYELRSIGNKNMRNYKKTFLKETRKTYLEAIQRRTG